MSYKYFLLPQRTFNRKKHCVCLVLSNEYNYIWKDWYDSKECCVSLLDPIKYKEKHDINRIKK